MFDWSSIHVSYSNCFGEKAVIKRIKYNIMKKTRKILMAVFIVTLIVELLIQASWFYEAFVLGKDIDSRHFFSITALTSLVFIILLILYKDKKK